MTEHPKLRVGMAVHLIKMPDRREMLDQFGVVPGAIGRIIGAGETEESLTQVEFDGGASFWLGRDNISPTSTQGS